MKFHPFACSLLLRSLVLIALLPKSGMTESSDVTAATEEIGSGVYVFRYDSHQSLFVLSDEGVIVTDPLNDHAAALYRQEIAKITERPVTHVIYSYSHWDRISGGQIFKDEGAQSISQERCITSVKVRPNSDIVMPDITFADTYTLELGGRGLDLYYLGLHYDCTTVMITRPDNRMYVVGTVNPPAASVPTNPSMSSIYVYNLVSVLETLDDLAERKNVETMIGAKVMVMEGEDGRPKLIGPTGSITVIVEQQAFWSKLFNDARAARASGIGGAEVGMAIDHTPYKYMPGYDEKNLAWITRRVQSAILTGKEAQV